MKKYIGDLIISIMGILVGSMFVYYGFQPGSSSIPIIIAFVGILGVVGIFAVLAGVIGVIRTIHDISRHFKKKKTA
jgi:hypothetical protein